MLKKLTLILMIVTISLSIFAWEINQQADFPVIIYDVQTIGSDVWVVGSGGGVAHSTDGGENFSFVQTPAFNQATDTHITTYSVDFYDQNNGIIVGKDGLLMKTTDGGQNWATNTQIADLFGTADIESVVYHSDGKVWVSGYGGKIGYSSDFGENWVLQTSGTSNSLYSISVNENGRGFVAANNGSSNDATYLYTSDFGQNWEVVHPDIDGDPTLFSVKQIGDEVIFTGDDGYIGISHDGGQTFTHHPLAGGDGIRMYDVVMNGSTGYAVGWKSTILKTTDNWDTFESVENNFGTYFSAIDFDENQNLIAVGWQGTIVKSSDEGVTWVNKAVPSYDIYASSFAGNTLWLVGDKGMIRKSTDNGASFEDVFIPNSRGTYYSVYAKNDNEVFVTGKTSGNIYHTIDGGQNWDTFTFANASGSTKLYKILFTSDQIGYVFGYADFCAKTTDGGESWNLLTNNFQSSERIYSAEFFDDNTGFVGGKNGNLYYTNDGGDNWTYLALGTDDIKSISFKDQNNGILTTYDSQILYTHNGGLTVSDWAISSENATDHILGSYYDDNIALTCGYSNDDSNIGNDFAILASDNDGESWNEESFNDLTFNPTRLTSIVSTGSKYIVTGKNGVILSKDAIQNTEPDLFISEYIEGSASNKAVEIFNGTGSDVDLSQYSVKLAPNGGDWGNVCDMTGILADGDVYVIANSGSDDAILAVADTTSNITYFNGDDALGLFKNDIQIDAIGVQGVDPGSAWDVAGITNATKNHTLVRKPDVSQGDLDWTASAGTNADDSEWIVYDQNTFEYLGSHTHNGGNVDYVATPIITPNGEDFTDPIDVEISCSTENAIIYYTLDGSDPNDSTDPDNTSAVYTAPINISETTTLKAAAYAQGMEPSTIATAQFNHIVIVQVANINDLRAGNTDGTVYQLTGEAVITYQQSYRNQKYIQDASAAILIDDNNNVITTEYNIGDGITNLTGTLSEYGNMIQFIPSQDPGVASSTGNEIVPEVVSLSDLTNNFADYQSELIKVENVSFENGGDIFANGQVYNVTDSEQNGFGFRTTFYNVNYIGGTIPNYNVDIVGICNSKNDGNYFTARDSSDFSLNAPDETIIVTSPNGGESWQQNSTHPITWTSANFEGQIKIELLTDGRNKRTRSVVLVDSLENSGTWSWNIPSDLETGDLYTIKISDSQDGDPFDVSDADFSVIAPAEPPVIVINEIMYNPATSLGNDADYEYLELYNAGTSEANLTGWTIQNACTYSFEDGTTLPVNGYLVVALNPQMIMDHYAIENVVGPFNGALNNSGETIELHNAESEIVDEVTYSDSDPWPTSPDGQGPSLELISPELDNSLAENWQASFVADGTPGIANTVVPVAVPHTIYEIQFTENEDGTSDLVGERVQTSGIITAIFNNGFFMQDGEGAWNGIMVNSSVEDAQLGQEITLDATVSEANNQTTLNEIANVVLGDINDLPAPVEITTNTVATDEAYEGVLVKVSNAICTNDSLGYGEWEIDDNSGPCRVDDMGYAFTPQLQTYYDVTGVVNYSYSNFKLEPRDADDITIITDNNDEHNQIYSVKLIGNYPNPFNPQTTIAFTTKETGNVSIVIYNVVGQKIRTLVNKSYNSGQHRVVWNGKNDFNKTVGSGIYFYNMRNGKYTSTKKMILLK